MHGHGQVISAFPISYGQNRISTLFLIAFACTFGRDVRGFANKTPKEFDLKGLAQYRRGSFGDRCIYGPDSLLF
jgi:hypothetical protein